MKMWMTFLSFLGFFTLTPSAVHAFELMGLVGYDVSAFSNKPANYLRSTNGVSYEFMGRLELGPGAIESGFLFAPTGITTHELFADVTTNGTYWLIPLLYRIPIYSPFLSLGLGLDYAIVGNTTLSILGPQANGLNSGYQSHFGAEASLEATQDVGENLSLVLDARYRMGLANAITFNGTDTRYNFFMFALGLQKRLE